MMLVFLLGGQVALFLYDKAYEYFSGKHVE